VISCSGTSYVKEPPGFGLLRTELSVCDQTVEHRFSILVSEIHSHTQLRIEEGWGGARGVPAGEVGDYHHRPFEPFGGVDRHEAHRVSGFERRARDLCTGLVELPQPAHHREGVVSSMLQVAC